MGSDVYRLRNVELDVQAYQLRGQPESEGFQQSQESADNGEDVPKARILNLPSMELDGLWES